MTDRYRLDQLDEELRVALVAPQRLGLSWSGGAYPRVVGIPPGGWTDAKNAAVIATCDAHIPDPTFGETQDARFIRLILTDTDFDAYLAAPPATVVPPVVARKVIRSARALAKIIRNEAT